jgi:cellulose synthase/poly-beta-1,6-N-acetylglucosamine synthase-like glycosyltransferase
VTTRPNPDRSLLTLADVNAIRLLIALFVIVGTLTAARTLLLFLPAGRDARHRRRQVSWGPPVTEPVTVIVPAGDDGPSLSVAVRSLAAGDHEGGIEVIVVGSVPAWELPNVRVVESARPGPAAPSTGGAAALSTGRAAALSAGLAAATGRIVVVADADTVVEPDSVRRLVQPFADPSVGAVAGNLQVGNRGSLVARWQQVEYVTGTNVDRRLYGTLRCLPSVPAAFGAFRRAALDDVGGFRDDTIDAETDATMAIGRAGWRVVYEGSARAWTEAPGTLEALLRQRYRRTLGTIQAIRRHGRSMVDRGAYLALFGIVLPVLAPAVDVAALYGVLFGDRLAAAAAWTALLGVQALTAVAAFRLDRERLEAPWALPVQQLAFRHLTWLVLLPAAAAALTTAGRAARAPRRITEAASL